MPVKYVTEPNAERLAFYRELRDDVVNPARDILNMHILPVLREAERTDGIGDRINDVLWRIRIAIEERAAATRSKAVELARRIFGRVEKKQGRDLEKEVGGRVVVQADTRRLAEFFVAQNVQLITSIAPQYLEEVGRVVTQAAFSGQRDLPQMLAARYDITLNRAKLIARDQVGKLYGHLAKERQEALGFTHYIWRTRQDNRVRDEHVALEGRRFAWEGSEPGFIPGEPVNCRCFALPSQ